LKSTIQLRCALELACGVNNAYYWSRDAVRLELDKDSWSSVVHIAMESSKAEVTTRQQIKRGVTVSGVKKYVVDAGRGVVRSTSYAAVPVTSGSVELEMKRGSSGGTRHKVCTAV
jgi:hypothetical protein